MGHIFAYIVGQTLTKVRHSFESKLWKVCTYLIKNMFMEILTNQAIPHERINSIMEPKLEIKRIEP